MDRLDYVGTLWEEWRDIEGFEGRYQVSNEGRVRSLNYNRTEKVKVMKCRMNTNGYHQVPLTKDGKMKMYLVHRLVYESFVGQIPDDMQVNHLDEVKTNNSLSNLKLTTPSENTNYGTGNKRRSKTLTGKNINRQDQSKPVHQIDKVTGEILNTYPSVREAYRKTGIAYQNISECCKGNQNRSHAGGYKWSF